MASLITLKGIDQAISNLTYKNKNALKYRLVTTIRQYYKDENSVETIQGVDADELAKFLWNIGDDPTATKSKRKNLRRIRYALNTDLRGLYKEGKNPEGITIGPTNIFVMSHEAKDRTLKALIADRDGLMGADLAELAREYQAPEEVSRKGTGLLEQVGPPEELMNEEEIVHAIDELDEDFVLESLEVPGAAEEIGEPTQEEELSEVEEPHEVHAVAEPREGEARGIPEEAEAGAFTEEVEEDQDPGEIAFDAEETQYLTGLEEEKTAGEPHQAEPGQGIAGLKDDTEKFEQAGSISTEDSEQEVSPEEAQGAEKTITSRPNDISMLQQLAAAKEKSGELEAALDLYQKILNSSPGDEKAEEACLRLSLKLLDKKGT
jgi:tetratricopeptide (TPR) repeat protein